MKSDVQNMPRTIAAAAALVAFAVCLLLGLEQHNSFTTTVGRALAAMAGTFAVGWVIGWAAKRMLDEHLAQQEKKTVENEQFSDVEDR